MGSVGAAPRTGQHSASWLNEISVRQVFNLIYVHLVNKTAHAEKCEERPGRGLVCASDCQTAKFIDALDGPLFPWEIREAARLDARRTAFLRGDIPA